MRLYRLLAIVMLLINRDKINAQDLACYFEVSPRTIYRDLDTINEAGIPVISHQGADGGFSIMDNFKIDKNILTPEEIIAIITALEGINSTLDDRKIKDITLKMRSLFKGYNPEDDVPEEMVIDLTPWENNQEIQERLILLKKAIKEKRTAQINYLNSRKEGLKRIVEPLSLVLKGNIWYLYAYCHLRNDYRIFRITRMSEIIVQNSKFSRKEKTFADFEKENNWGKDLKPVNITLKFQPQALLRVQDYFSNEQKKINNDGSITVELTWPEDDWVYGFILSFGDDVEVLEPAYIRNIISTMAQKVVKIYKPGLKV